MEKAPHIPEQKATSPVGHKPETTPRKFEGMHDYLSNIRVLDFEYKKNGIAGLFTYIKDHKLETWDGYVERVRGTNPDLLAKLERDVAAYPEARENIRAYIERINDADNPSDLFYAYQDLKDYFS